MVVDAGSNERAFRIAESTFCAIFPRLVVKSRDSYGPFGSWRCEGVAEVEEEEGVML